MIVDHANRFERFGFHLERSLFDRDLIERCRREIEDFVARADTRSSDRVELETAFAKERPAVLSTANTRRVVDFLEDCPAAAAVARHAGLQRMLDSIRPGARRIFHSMALLKPPFIGSAKPWHQDAAYFSVGNPDKIVGVWIALQPADPENGCMTVLPGSHLNGPVPHRKTQIAHQCGIDEVMGAGVDLPMEAGDALLFDSLLIHRTGANRSKRPRQALQLHFHSDGLKWIPVSEHAQLFCSDDGTYAGCVNCNTEALWHAATSELSGSD